MLLQISGTPSNLGASHPCPCACCLHLWLVSLARGKQFESLPPIQHPEQRPLCREPWACAFQSSPAQAGPCCSKLHQHVPDFQSQTLRNRPIFKIYNAIHRVNFSSRAPRLGWAKFLRVAVWVFFCLSGLFLVCILFGWFFSLSSLRWLMWVIDWFFFCLSDDLIGFVRPKWTQNLVEVFEGLC